MFNQVTAFLTQNNLLDSNQSGFRSGHSTETALLSVVEDLRLARTASKSSLLILLVCLLLLIRSTTRSSCQPYWERASQEPHSSGMTLTSQIGPFQVSWRGEVSKSQHLATGVPQGSVLGPLLFSVYIASIFLSFRNMAFHITAMLMTLNSISHSILMIWR